MADDFMPPLVVPPTPPGPPAFVPTTPSGSSPASGFPGGFPGASTTHPAGLQQSSSWDQPSPWQPVNANQYPTFGSTVSSQTQQSPPPPTWPGATTHPYNAPGTPAAPPAASAWPTPGTPSPSWSGGTQPWSPYPTTPANAPQDFDPDFHHSSDPQHPISSGGFGMLGTPAPVPGHFMATNPPNAMSMFPPIVNYTPDGTPNRSRSKKKRRNSDAGRSLSVGHGDVESAATHLPTQWPASSLVRNRTQPHRGRSYHRPRDWRVGYTSKTMSTLPFLNLKWNTKDYSLVEEYKDDTARDLHPSLRYIKGGPALHFDIRVSPWNQTSSFFPFFGRHPSEHDFIQYATNPPTHFLRVFHKDLPWYIDVTPKVGLPGVTVYDVLSEIFSSLSNMIHDSHFYTEALSDQDRGKITQAFQARCTSDAGELARGVHRVDFLGPKVIFRGLVRKNGMYALKLFPY